MESDNKDRIARYLQIAAGILAAGGLFMLPTCRGRFSTLMSGTYDEIVSGYTLAGALFGAAVLCLFGSFLVPSSKDRDRGRRR